MPTEARKGDSEAFVLALLEGNELALNDLIGRNRWLLDVPTVRELDHGRAGSRFKSWTAGSPLSCAVQWGKPALVRTLLTAGADPNSADPNGATPLHHACQLKYSQGAIDVPARLLLKHRADPNPKSWQDGVTPLLVSCATGFPEVVEQLLTAGADLSLRSATGLTALFVACSRADYDGAAKITRLLLQHLAAAIREEAVDGLWHRTLLEVRTKRGETCGYVRSHSNPQQQQLQNKKNSPTWNARAIITPLHHILNYFGCTRCSRVPRSLQTPLMAACQHGNTNCVLQLLHARADCTATTPDGELSALQIANVQGHSDCAFLLRNAAAQQDRR